MKHFCYLTIAFALLFIISFSGTVFAHRDDFIDETLVYVTLEKNEIEPEYWLDFGYKNNEKPGAEEDSQGSFDKRTEFLRHNFAIEYGITPHWMVEGRGTIKNIEDKKTIFDSGRFETRYRLFEEGAKPIDTALSMEVNTERDEHSKQQPAIEPRIILSKDFGALNLTANLQEKIFLRSADLAFVPSLGIRYNLPKILRFGCEVKFDTESHEDSVMPQVWFTFPHEMTIKLGYSFGFDRNEENFGRMALEVGF